MVIVNVLTGVGLLCLAAILAACFLRRRCQDDGFHVCLIICFVLFLAPILTFVVFILAYVDCVTSDKSQASWAFPTVGYLAFFAAVAQGQLIAFTFGNKPSEEDDARFILVFRAVTFCMLVISLSLSTATLIPFHLHVLPSYEDGRAPFSGGSFRFLFWALDLRDDHPIPPPPTPPSPPLPPANPPPLLPLLVGNSNVTSETPVPFNALWAIVVLWHASNDRPTPPDTIGTWTLVGLSCLCVLFGVWLWLNLNGPSRWWEQLQISLRDADRNENTVEEGSCCSCILPQCFVRTYRKLMAPIKDQYVLVNVYHAVVAAFDFVFDLAYVLTQDFAMLGSWEPLSVPILWLLSVLFCVLPSALFLYSSGMMRAWAKYAWKLIIEEVKNMQSFSLQLYQVNLQAAIHIVDIVIKLFGKGVGCVKKVCEWNFDNKRNQGEDPWTACEIVCRTALVLAGVAAGGCIFLGYFVVVSLTLLFSCIVCPIIVWVVFTIVLCPAYALVVVIVWPTLGLLWCVIHINFKLSLMPSLTVRLYKFMKAESNEHPIAEYEEGHVPRFVHFHINLSFLSEIAGESVPQLVTCVVNEVTIAAQKRRPYHPSTLGWAQLIGSVFAILTNVWPHGYWRLKYGSCFGDHGSLSTIILPLDEQEAATKKEIQMKAARCPTCCGSKEDFRDTSALDDIWAQNYANRPPSPPGAVNNGSCS